MLLPLVSLPRLRICRVSHCSDPALARPVRHGGDTGDRRILAAYGGVFVAWSLAWGVLLDGFRPDRYDIGGAAVRLAGVAVIMYAPR